MTLFEWRWRGRMLAACALYPVATPRGVGKCLCLWLGCRLYTWRIA